ncbi:alpha-mannosidase [Terrabacter terrigena]|uniref:Alpha-mannosidase n=1 Tax=Terrabacter terrigena TaxID=574718 RepID=A0ABW3N0L2_9MICO
MFDDSAHVLRRARRVLAEHVTPAVHRDRVPLATSAWHVAGEPVPVAVALGVAARGGFEPAGPGTPWGEPWSTWWFEITGSVPEAFAGECVEVVVDLGFRGEGPGFQAEGLLHDADGTPLKGIHPMNRWFRVSPSAAGGEQVHLFLEAAGNPAVMEHGFRPTGLGEVATAGAEPRYLLGRVDVAVFEPEVFGLAMDLDVLVDLATELPERDARRLEVTAALDDALAALDVHDIRHTAAAARAALVEVLAAPAVTSAQRLTAVGHAHIDSAWLWPVRETVRKCARTFANVTALAADYPELVFACSSAQQYAWMKERQPAIWQRIKDAVAAGTWEPVGGQWVEADGVMPSGESLVRQLLHGQRFFERELGVRCRGVWLPDSFGYSAAYPQIARLAGAEWFLTQKLSWNDTNTFPHHTFWWEGIDGTRVLTHFPPADTYESKLGGAEVHRSARQHLDKGRSRRALIPFGFGDGGGGPEREMLERARRLRSLEGSPAVEVGTAQSFFDGVRDEYADRAPTWVGELYLELHRGTLTSQRAMKVGNRGCEALLRQAELVWTLVAVHGLGEWPAERLRLVWERLLLLQFHDILPGSAIAWVHREARDDFERLTAELRSLVDEGLELLSAVGGPGGVGAVGGPGGLGGVGGGLLNAGPYARREVVDGAQGRVLVDVPALSVGGRVVDQPANPVSVEGLTVTNGLVSVTVSTDGSIDSLVDHRHDDRQVLPAGARAAELRLHPDVPAMWDAWDIDKPHSRTWTSPVDTVVEVVESGSLRVVVEARGAVGRSTFVQRTTVTADSPRVDVEVRVDWRERERALAAYVPVSVLAPHSSADIQFGHLRRPTHENTSWESARHEMVAHRWLHVGEEGWGVALVNEATYGHAVRRSVTGAGEPVTTMRLTLLRSPSFPDPTTDSSEEVGEQVVRFGIVPGADVAEAVEHGYAVHLPLLGARTPTGADGSVARVVEVGPLVEVGDPAVVVEAVKLAEDGSGDVVVRLYESRGGRARSVVRPGFEWSSVAEVDLLEEDSPALDGRHALVTSDAAAAAPGGRVTVELRPFQLVTLRFTRVSPAP